MFLCDGSEFDEDEAMSTTRVESTHEERIVKRRRRSQRYHPLMEPMLLPEGFVETVHRILGLYVSELRTAMSWLDQEIGMPLASSWRSHWGAGGSSGRGCEGRSGT